MGREDGSSPHSSDVELGGRAPSDADERRQRASLFGRRKSIAPGILMLQNIDLSSSGRRGLAVAVVAAAILLARSASATSGLRIAVAMEQPADLALPAQFGDAAATRALAQGVREACLDPGSLRPRKSSVACPVLRDVPGSQVCVEETAERALTLEIKCDGAAATAEAIDLSRSGCGTADCFAVEARRAAATHLLVVRGTWKDGLVLSGNLTDLATGEARAVAPSDFETNYNAEWPRSGPQVLGLLKWFARETALRALATEERLVVGRSRNGGEVALIAPPKNAPVPERGAHEARWLGWALVGAGVAAGAAGWFVWQQDKDLTACSSVSGDTDPCRRLNRTVVPAVALGLGAIGAFIGGSIILLRGRDGDARVALSVCPSGVVVGGRL